MDLEHADISGLHNFRPDLTTGLITQPLPSPDIPAATPQDHSSREAWRHPQQDNSQAHKPSPNASPNDVTYSLPGIQRDLRLIRTHLDTHPTESPASFLSSERFKAFAELEKQLHQLSEIFFSIRLASPADGPWNPYCTKSIGNSFLRAIATVLKIYEILTRRMSPASPRTARTAEGSYEPPFTDVPRPPLSPLGNSEPDETMQIGRFTPSPDLALWLQLQFHLDTNLSSSNTADFASPSTSPSSSSSSSHRDTSLRALTTVGRVTFTQLCNDLLARFQALERVVALSIQRHQSSLQSP